MSPLITKSRRRKAGFLENYRLDDKYMLKPDRSAGRPGIYGGLSPEGTPILVKVWARANDVNDLDLQDIWRHELRQLHRLAGSPGAADSIAHLHDAGYDPQGFYLILAPGQRQPLQSLLDVLAPDHWLKQARSANNRARVWRNLRQLSIGLETLHSQGLLHRNIDAWAVLTAGGSETDFQLTGFEWSMRIVGAEGAKPHKGRITKTVTTDSFHQDWLMFGLLAAELLGIKRSRLMDRSLASHDVAEHVGVEEIRLLRNLVQVNPLAVLNGETVATRIVDILRAIIAEIAGTDGKYHLAVRLGRGSPLADRIRSASGGEIESDDFDAQLAFVADDLIESPLLLAIRSRDGDDIRLVLRGKHLLYRLQEFRGFGHAQPTWEFAYCEAAENVAPASVAVAGQRLLLPSTIEVMPLATAYDRFPRLRGKLSSWEDLRREFEREQTPLSREQVVHRALCLLQLLEALYAAADVFPVEVLPQPAGVAESKADGDQVLRVRTRPDSERDALAKALRLKSPAIRLAKKLDNDGSPAEGWILSDDRSLGGRDPSDTEWQFRQVESVGGQPVVFVFTGADAVPPLRDPVLVPAGAIGRDTQFRRRLKALNALKDHQELLRMITDPRQRVLESHDVLTEDSAFEQLDAPKQEALRQLTATLPLYLIQGPPGVGKTRLVRDLVRRRFMDEPTTRLLLTAQSHAAIDHLLDELEEILQPDSADGPLVVRCSGKDEVDAPSRFDIREQSRQLVTRLAGSPLTKGMPKRFSDALDTLASSSIRSGDPSGRNVVSGRAATQALRAFEGVVARAANVVFATTNSGELERLIDERGQFDWAIVEEAAKATGSELISPLLLSHRRLMIGDHKQLPAFASDQLKKLLTVPEDVKQALMLGEEFIGKSLRDATTDEIFDDVEDDESRLPALCAEALRLLTFFETAIEAEFQRQATKRGGRPIAKKLTAQHRMHPAIAELVSRCFYGDLETDASCRKRFETFPHPFTSSDLTRLPLNPIVVIDMPYVQANVRQKEGDRNPAWHNPMEVTAAVEILSLLTSAAGADKLPTLAVLSPYSQQVRRLDNAIQEAKQNKLAHLDNSFRASSHSGAFCHTVDSFQGSEADIVVVSLVRNNEHSNVDHALGFLCDLRRMNVLLSRAKWQLVLIASVDFLSEVVGAAKGGNDEDRIRFIATMLDVLAAGQVDGSVARVPFERLMKEAQ